MALPADRAQLRRWLNAAKIEDGPVFRPVNKVGVVGDTALQGGEVSRTRTGRRLAGDPRRHHAPGN